MRLHNLIPLFFILGAGCADLDESGELDGIDDDLPAGDKADTGTLAENTPDAYAVLQVANHADLGTLVLKVRLGAQAAGAIIATRLGDDGLLNTRDDIKFASLRKLDEVTWVGPKTFERLRDWGKQNGYGMPDLYGSYLFRVRLGNGQDVQFDVVAQMEPSGRFAQRINYADDKGDRVVLSDGLESHVDRDTVHLRAYWPDDIPVLWDSRMELEGVIRSGDHLCGSGYIGGSDFSQDVTWAAVRLKPGASRDPFEGCR